jgi:hypothetical protein
VELLAFLTAAELLRCKSAQIGSERKYFNPHWKSPYQTSLLENSPGECRSGLKKPFCTPAEDSKTSFPREIAETEAIKKHAACERNLKFNSNG